MVVMTWRATRSSQLTACTDEGLRGTRDSHTLGPWPSEEVHESPALRAYRRRTLLFRGSITCEGLGRESRALGGHRDQTASHPTGRRSGTGTQPQGFLLHGIGVARRGPGAPWPHRAPATRSAPSAAQAWWHAPAPPTTATVVAVDCGIKLGNRPASLTNGGCNVTVVPYEPPASIPGDMEPTGFSSPTAGPGGRDAVIELVRAIGADAPSSASAGHQDDRLATAGDLNK